jgi:hypothetical protein
VPNSHPTFLHRHSLSIASAGILSFSLLLYAVSNPDSYAGAFFGNAVSDWVGVLVTVLATKHLSERKDRKKPAAGRPPGERVAHFAHNHSLTVFLALTWMLWVAVYLDLPVVSKWGQVAGSLVSEWTQTLAMLWMSKRLIERSVAGGNAPDHSRSTDVGPSPA